MMNPKGMIRLLVLACATFTLTSCSSNPSVPKPPVPDQGVGQSLFVGGDIFDESQQGPISVVNVNASTGQLTELTDSPFSELSNISGLFPASGGKFLFFTKSQFIPQGNTPPSTQDTSGLYRIALGTAGELLGTPVFLGRLGALMDSSGSFLFVQDSTLLSIGVQKIDTATGNLIPQLGKGLSFSQQVALQGIAGNRIWIDPNINNVAGQLMFQPVDMDPATGSLTLVPVQLAITLSSQRSVDTSYSQHSVVVRTNQESAFSLTVYSEDGSTFKQIQTCTATDSPICAWKPSFSKNGDLAFFIANGILWSVPFDPASGFHLNAAKSVQINDNFSELVTNSDDSVLYALNPTTGHIAGFKVDAAGNLSAIGGSDVTTRMPPTGSFAAFSVGTTIR